MDEALVDLRDAAAVADGAAALPARGRVPSRRPAAGAAQLPRAGGDLRRQRHGPGQPARGGAGDAERRRRWSTPPPTSAISTANARRATARTTRSAATIRTAPPRPAPRSSRRASARSFLAAGGSRGSGDRARRQRRRRRRLERGPAGSRPGALGDERPPVAIRYPQATRPWQHVLEPLAGYLMLGERLLADPRADAEAWNFGPDASGQLSVAAGHRRLRPAVAGGALRRRPLAAAARGRAAAPRLQQGEGAARLAAGVERGDDLRAHASPGTGASTSAARSTAAPTSSATSPTRAAPACPGRWSASPKPHEAARDADRRAVGSGDRAAPRRARQPDPAVLRRGLRRRPRPACASSR